MHHRARGRCPRRCGARRSRCRPPRAPRDRTHRGARRHRACGTGTAPALPSRADRFRRARARGRSASPWYCARCRLCAPRLLVSGGHRSYKRRMAWHPATFARILAPLALLACGGSSPPPKPPKPEPMVEVKPPPKPPETEEDRENRRHADAVAIVPEGKTCLPAQFKNPTAPRLELAAIKSDAVVCAVDQDRTRLLGPIACWTVAVSGDAPGALSYVAPTPLPGRGLAVMLDDRCARGFCLPKEAKLPTDAVALMAWNLEGSKVAVLAGDEVHVFNAATKAHESSFPIRGDKGVTSDPTAIHWNGEAIFIEASDGNTSPVFVFKPDGIPLGPIEALGGKDKAPLSTRSGSFLLLDHTRVAVSEQGMSTLTIYETDTGKRTKLVRKLPASTCKKDEIEAVWHDPGANVSAKCK